MVTFKCRKCGHSLGDAERSAGKCPACGAEFGSEQNSATIIADNQSEQNGIYDTASGGNGDRTVVPSDMVKSTGEEAAEKPSSQATVVGAGKTVIGPSVLSDDANQNLSNDQTIVGGEGGNIHATINPMYLAADKSEQPRGLANLVTRKGAPPATESQKAGESDLDQQTIIPGAADDVSEDFSVSEPKSPSKIAPDATAIGETIVSVRKVDGLGGHHVSRADYQILGTLGKGGMGIVYEARQASTNRNVALKMLLPKEAAKPSRRQTLMSEAVINGNLTHPNIVPVHDLGQDDEGNLFYSMKRVEGEKWESVIKQKTEAENLEILLKVADAVAFSHARGIVHCDLKPENVLLGEFGEVLLMDWGLAYATEGFEKRDSILLSDNPGGSPAYMAPEQARNFLISCKYMEGTVVPTGPATDIYLLGAILFQIIAGKAPHLAENVTKTVAAAAKNEIWKPEVESGYLEIACKAMALQPADRYESVPALQAAIRGHLAHEQSVALNKRAEEHFRAKDYSRAITVCEDALALWAGNNEAANRMTIAERRLRRRRNAVGTMAVTLTLAVVGFTLGIYQQRNKALEQERIAVEERDKADLAAKAEKAARDVAEVERKKADESAQIAINQKKIADQAAIAERQAKELALAEKQKADEATVAEKKAKEFAQAEKMKADEAAIAEKKARELAVAEKMKADESAIAEKKAKEIALAEKKKADEAAIAEKQAKEVAIAEKQKADEAAIAEKKAKEVAVAEKMKADEAAIAEKKAKEAAVAAAAEAVRQEGLALRSAGRASIKLAKEQYDKDLFDAAEKTLAGIRDPEMTNSWEYRHLKYVLQQDYPSLPVTSDVNAVASDPQGRFLLTGEANGDIRVWDSAFRIGAEPKPRSVLKFQAAIHAIAVSPNGTLIAVAGDAEFGKPPRVRIWQAPADGVQGEFVERKVEMPVDDERATLKSLTFSPDGTKLLSTSTDGYVYIWNVATAQRLAKVRPTDYLSAPKPSAPNAPNQVAVSPDGTKFVVAHSDGYVYGWEFAPASTDQNAQPTANGQPHCVGCFYAHREECKERSVFCVATGLTGSASAPDSEWSIVSGGSDGNLLVWSWDQLQDLKQKEPLEDVVRNKLKLTGSSSVRMVRAVERRTSGPKPNLIDEKLRGLKASQSAIRAVGFTRAANGTPLIVSAGDDSLIRLWGPISSENTTQWKAPWQVLKRVRGQSHPIGSFTVFSPPQSKDNLFVLSGGEESQARLWNVTFYQDARSGDAEVLSGNARGFEKGVNDIYVARFVPGRRQLLTANAEEDMFGFRRFVEIVDLEAPQKNENHLSFTEGHHFPMRVERLATFPDGKRLLSVGTDDTVIVWDMATGRELGRIQGIGTLGVAALSHDGKWIATGSTHRVDQKTSKQLTQFAKLWRTADLLNGNGTSVGKTPQPVTTLECGKHDVTSLAFSPDDKTILVGDADGRCILWDRESKDVPPSFQVHGKPGELTWVRAAQFLADGQHAVTVGSNGSIARWNVKTGVPTSEPLSARQITKIKIDDVAISLDGNRVALAGRFSAATVEGSELQVWDLAQRRKLWESRVEGITSIDFSPDGSRIVTTGATKQTNGEQRHVLFWDASSGSKTEQALENRNASTKSPEFAIFSRDGKSIVTESVTIATAGIVEQKVAWWDVSSPGAKTAKRLNEFSLTTVIASADLSADARHVVTVNVDGTMDILEVVGNALHWIKKVSVDKENGEPLLTVALSPVKGSYAFVTGSRDGTVRVGKIVPEKLSGPGADGVEWTIPAWKHKEQVWTTAFSPDGKLLLTGGFDGQIFVCRTDDLSKPLVLEHKPADDETGQVDSRFSSVLCATFISNPANPSELAVVSGAGDGVTRVWRLSLDGVLTSDLALQLKGHREDIYGICAFQSGNSVRFITAGKDKTTNVWDPTRLWDKDPDLKPGDRVQEALSLQEYHTGPIRAVAYSPETNAVLTAGADGRTILYPAPLQEK